MIDSKIPLLLGAHISTEGGLFRALEKGSSIGCSVIQIFTKSNRQWAHSELTPKEIDAFLHEKEKYKIMVVSHASYLINLASDNIATAHRSINALVKELERCNTLDIPYVVLHPGSHVSLTEQEGIKRLIQSLGQVLELYHGNTMLLLETMAGQGSSLGKTFDQIALILKNVGDKRVGVCIDTCHLFAAGYSFSSKEEYQNLWHLFDQKIGLEKIKAIHLNDSKKECNSRVDRHEDIGKGKIGIEGFKLLMNDPRFFEIPKILETPKETLSDDQRNMEILISLITPETKKSISIFK